ncbi:Arc/MetJ-type ribon-helix-helix transcriptional regulator [Rhizobium mongolense]|uniref:Arc/MetJ-type ribon-helix-helix transcriptional regulator n=1 Tax=Rhizobium mongolense TaxID=57676 RepID=A0A7W6WH51_9HYPH|nr:Arc/MetJ-type ribon-helix-helix transcriptional regulator [Rhizobium mongolense]
MFDCPLRLGARRIIYPSSAARDSDISSTRYENASEYIRALIRQDLQNRDEAWEALQKELAPANRREVVMAERTFHSLGEIRLFRATHSIGTREGGRRWLSRCLVPMNISLSEAIDGVRVASEANRAAFEQSCRRGQYGRGYPSDFGEGVTAEHRHSDPRVQIRKTAVFGPDLS